MCTFCCTNSWIHVVHFAASWSLLLNFLLFKFIYSVNYVKPVLLRHLYFVRWKSIICIPALINFYMNVCMQCIMKQLFWCFPKQRMHMYGRNNITNDSFTHSSCHKMSIEWRYCASLELDCWFIHAELFLYRCFIYLMLSYNVRKL